jgi:predicted dinucleotide-binding enzyme
MKAMLLAMVSLVCAAPSYAATPEAGAPLKIGIIGTGKIGSALAANWAKAGHEVFISSRHPEQLQALAKSLGPKARVGTPQEAAAFGEVVLISVPYAAVPQVGRDYASQLRGKVVLETGNPYPQRDGDMAQAARQKGSGLSSNEFLPGVKLVRAFNAIAAASLAKQERRNGERVGIPLAGDDREALGVAARLVRDAGFEPVIVGGLARAKDFDVDTAVYGKLLTAQELRTQLGVAQ